jgi:hypothetical protein
MLGWWRDCRMRASRAALCGSVRCVSVMTLRAMAPEGVECR